MSNDKDKAQDQFTLEDDKYDDIDHPAYQDNGQPEKTGASRMQRTVLIVVLVFMALGMVAQMFAGR